MSVATKNPFDLLGNDDGDSDTPTAPVKTVDKTSTHTVKRNTDGVAPASRAPAPGSNRRGGVGGSEGAFRDRNAGSDRNRAKTTDDSPRGSGPRGGHNARVRGGRGGRFPRERDDRHAKNNLANTSEKAEGQAWGATDGEAELKDEQAGEAIAQSEQKEATAEGEGVDDKAEPEAKNVTLSDYLAQQAEKKLALGQEAQLKIRQPNEGTKENKKWANAKPLVKDEDEDYFAGSGGKAKRERERKVKQVVEIDNRYIEPERPRGGRGGRGDSSRGGGRGDGRGRGRGRGGGGVGGDFRGGHGGSRGGRGDGAPLNTEDKNAFPSLGA